MHETIFHAMTFSMKITMHYGLHMIPPYVVAKTRYLIKAA